MGCVVYRYITNRVGQKLKPVPTSKVRKSTLLRTNNGAILLLPSSSGHNINKTIHTPGHIFPFQANLVFVHFIEPSYIRTPNTYTYNIYIFHSKWYIISTISPNLQCSFKMYNMQPMLSQGNPKTLSYIRN